MREQENSHLEFRIRCIENWAFMKFTVDSFRMISCKICKKIGTLSNTVHCALFLLQRNKNSGWFTNRRELSTTWTEYTYHVSIFIHWIEFHIIILRNSYLFARENEKLELCQLNFWIMHEWKMFASSANQPVISTKESTHK